MAAASDKARFYLEQYVPELQELAQKEIFTRDEITSIAAKRSDFEHTLNARGSSPADYARYVAYEMNLDSLRKKRCRRLRIKTTMYSGQRTIFFILDRATKKFPGDMGLWMQYIDFCKSQKAAKKLGKVFTQVLRLKPREAGLWILAAKYYAETQGDMAAARAFMQRGLRFCNDKPQLWIEYTKLEMVYLSKISARRKVLGLSENPSTTEQPSDANDDLDQDLITFPTITAEDLGPEASKGIEELDTSALQRLATAPALQGGLPLAIFDAAMKNFIRNTPVRNQVAQDFFDLIFTFDATPIASHILQHILAHLRATAPASPETIICEAKEALFNIQTKSADFPVALSKTLPKLSQGLKDFSGDQRAAFAEKAVLLLVPYLREHESLDEAIVVVLEGSVNSYLKALVQMGRAKVKAKTVRRLVDEFAEGKMSADAVVRQLDDS